MYTGQKAFLGLSWSNIALLKLVTGLWIRLDSALCIRRKTGPVKCLQKV